jgi:hypothetical protein
MQTCYRQRRVVALSFAKVWAVLADWRTIHKHPRKSYTLILRA